MSYVRAPDRAHRKLIKWLGTDLGEPLVWELLHTGAGRGSDLSSTLLCFRGGWAPAGPQAEPRSHGEEPQLTAFSHAGTQDTVLTRSLGARALSLHASCSPQYPQHLLHVQYKSTFVGQKRFCEESQPRRCTNYRTDLTS